MDHKDTKVPRESLSEGLQETARMAVEAAFRVHATLGPGLSEKVYEACFLYECEQLGLNAARQVHVPIQYGSVRIDAGLRLDIVLNDCLIVELKAVESVSALHRAQLITYLKLTGHRLGLLINFNVPLIKDGIQRVVL